MTFYDHDQRHNSASRFLWRAVLDTPSINIDLSLSNALSSKKASNLHIYEYKGTDWLFRTCVFNFSDAYLTVEYHANMMNETYTNEHKMECTNLSNTKPPYPLKAYAACLDST